MSKRKYNKRPHVTEKPSPCLKCGSLERKVLRTRQMPRTSLLVDGIEYPGRVQRLVTCKNCGQNRFINTPLSPETAQSGLLG